MRVFLAGATGVIGSPLVPQLLKARHEVTAMTRSVLRAAQLEVVGANPVVCDVFDAEGVRAAMAAASPEAVIHQLTALPARLDWSNPNLFDANNRVRTEGHPDPRRCSACERGKTRCGAERRVCVRADGRPRQEGGCAAVH
jgi:nucleoside-diphosphate-sugar epimerase